MTLNEASTDDVGDPHNKPPESSGLQERRPTDWGSAGRSAPNH